MYSIGYKLFRKRRDNTYGSLFINKRQKLDTNVAYFSESHPTAGYAFRPGWHILSKPEAPHLSNKGRVWCVVAFKDYEVIARPEAQGGIWYLAKEMHILGEYNE